MTKKKVIDVDEFLALCEKVLSEENIGSIAILMPVSHLISLFIIRQTLSEHELSKNQRDAMIEIIDAFRDDCIGLSRDEVQYLSDYHKSKSN